MSDATVSWTTNLVEVHPAFKWYDFEKCKWFFRWQEWIEEIREAKDVLPKNLTDPKEYAIMADKKDLLLLRQLEKDGLTSFKKLSELVGISQRGVAYRYKKHFVERKLIIDHVVHFFPYPYQNASVCTLNIQFANQKKLAKFVNSLCDKPHVLSYAKVIGKNTLVANTYVPASEFPEFINTLSFLTKMDFITDFFHMTLTLIPHKRGGVPYEFFQNGAWKCGVDQSVNNLRLMKTTMD